MREIQNTPFSSRAPSRTSSSSFATTRTTTTRTPTPAESSFWKTRAEQIADIYENVGEWFNRSPRGRARGAKVVEPWRENSESIAFYNRPSEDGTRPGIYYANLADMKSVQKYVFGAITYHESVPGHHFQMALAMELEGLPKVRKFGGWNAFTEGWALYSEKLAKEMGFYQDPYLDFGRLQNELWRSVRLVTDTGIHAKKWTRQEAIDYFLENTPISEGDIVTEVERYFVNPGQALGYKMGMIKIEEAQSKGRGPAGRGVRHKAVSRRRHRHRSPAATNPGSPGRSLHSSQEPVTRPDEARSKPNQRDLAKPGA